MSDTAREMAKKLGELKLLNEWPPSDDSGWMPGEFDEETATALIDTALKAERSRAIEECIKFYDQFAPGRGDSLRPLKEADHA